MHGTGTFFKYDTQEWYHGEFQAGKKHGYGVEKDVAGQILFEGMFSNGNREEVPGDPSYNPEMGRK